MICIDCVRICIHISCGSVEWNHLHGRHGVYSLYPVNSCNQCDSDALRHCKKDSDLCDVTIIWSQYFVCVQMHQWSIALCLTTANRRQNICLNIRSLSSRTCKFIEHFMLRIPAVLYVNSMWANNNFAFRCILARMYGNCQLFILQMTVCRMPTQKPLSKSQVTLS